MAFNFKDLNDPEVRKEMEERKKAQELREQQIEEWRKITVGATGHRCEKLGGWHDALGGYDNKHPIVVKLRTVLLEVLENQILFHGKTRFVSGGALGFDSMFFWAVNHLKKKIPDIEIENVLAIPFVNQDKMWKPQQKLWYRKMLEVADTVIDVAREEEYSTREHLRKENPLSLDDFSGEKMKKRNMYMVDQSGVMVAFYDGSIKSGTGHCVRYAIRDCVFHRPAIIRLDPRVDYKPEYY